MFIEPQIVAVCANEYVEHASDYSTNAIRLIHLPSSLSVPSVADKNYTVRTKSLVDLTV